MSISPIKLVLESLRRKATGDDKYFRRMLMFFEIEVPPEHAFHGILNDYLFPIVIPPDSYKLSEPFAVEDSPTQGGGLYVEENGIVRRTIQLSGTTGFKVRPFRGSSWVLNTIKPEQKSHSRELPWTWLKFAGLTGHGHLKYLQDCVFRAYADLKRDPSSAEGTTMSFHIPKDDEHWLVAPTGFDISRDKGSPVTYRYDIGLLVKGPAGAHLENVSEDKSLLDQLKEAVQMIKTGIDLIQGGINDLTAIVSEIAGFVANIGTILDGLLGIVDAAKNFVEGITDFIENPFGSILLSNDAIDAARASYENLLKKATIAPDSGVRDYVLDRLSTIQDGLDRMGTHPEVFESTSRKTARENAKRSDLFQRVPTTELLDAESRGSPGTLTEVSNLGTSLTGGEVLSAKGTLFTSNSVRNYKSAQSVSVTKGDTLTSLASQYLGDSSRWEDIAIINGLKPPFIDAQASADLVLGDTPVLPGVLGTGDKIAIPSYQPSLVDRPLLPVLGARLDESLESQLLGTDFALEPTTSSGRNTLYDIPIDVEGGSVDAKLATGLPNLIQGLTYRMSTDRGSDTLYRHLGLKRVIGLNLSLVDLEASRFRISQCISQDPRIGSVKTIEFEGEDSGSSSPPENTPRDALITNISASVRGFSEGQRISVAV